MAPAIRAVDEVRDFRTLRKLFIEYENALPAHLRHGGVPGLAELAKLYAAKNRAFLAFFARAAIGCVAVREFDRRSALLLRLYVTPAHRGRGAARALVEAAIGFVRTCDYDRIVLDTNRDSLEPAYRLYRTLGFVECAPFTTVTYERPTFMELKLEL